MKIILTSILSLVFSFAIFAQQGKSPSCQVLIPSIAEQYEGECKKGLADGAGVARGRDLYKGEFKKGLPHGQGEYTWSTGEVYNGSWIQGRRDGYGVFSFRSAGVDSILTGYWKNDRYLGAEYRKYNYKVLESRDLDDTRFLQMDHVGNQVRIKIMKAGMENRNVSEVMLWGDSGYQSASFLGYEGVTFPFTCQLNYTTTNKLNTQTLICKLVFVIYEQGSWEVQAHN